MRAVIEPPSEEAISLLRAKRHLLIDDEADEDVDGDIEDGIVAAREALEGALHRPLLPQLCEVRADALRDRIRLWHDVTVLESVIYSDADGADQVLPVGQCRVEGGVWLRLSGSLPVASNVRVRFRCGAFPDPESVPRTLVSWMLLQLGSLDQIRQTVTHGQTFDVPSSYTQGLINRYVIEEL
ncbi:head-tail connector protein [Cupriavidus sp. WS]|uniref:head-tail connector protein n=1 Tax=Cupriavidus sp. WS TaxID=1312922 RepID=UPI00035EE255|nr:head-tail connector protein [Cupriavidus sp. WS]